MRGGSSPKKGGPAAQALGRSRGGFSTKIHVSVDGLGNPLRFILTGGQQHDITQAEELIAGYAGEHVLADKGYDAQEFRQHILELGMMPVIPPRSNRKAPADYDRHLYRERHLVECFINKISTIAGSSPGLEAGIPGLPDASGTCQQNPALFRNREGKAPSFRSSSRVRRKTMTAHLYRERHLVECFINKIKHTIAGSSPGLRSWTPDTWASCTSPPLSSGYGEMSTEPNRGGS